MQFFHLFSFVVVASYAAALPQPAELSEKYSNNADTNLASGLEVRSYQPVLNSKRDSATLVSLKRRDDSGSDSSSSPASNPKRIVLGSSSPLERAGLRVLLLFVKIKEFGTGLADTPENVKAAGAAVGGDTGDLLVQYLRTDLQATDSLNKWLEEAREILITAIKSGLGDEEYSKVKPLLDDASEKLTAGASGNLQQVTAALLAIEQRTAPVKPEMDAVQGAFGRTFDAYKLYFETLRFQLNMFASGQELNKYFYMSTESLVKFSKKQEDLYLTIRNRLKDAPSN
ncbi:hypothetical protein BASA50_006996 [Batrachochytrium salamandrivorans]|uniref:Uncharacterized protein n=1 Tax=Batrachochytrium salamandrivorans TaxID=1357716 RepID=A0ABQ8F8P7_9FUNG|nr:hypothetical protein BASA50_006996 [Batrachochytrium salamandrivorans]KAH9270661.1 hypothetical protein BASA83_007270 [Batrachochytrium salamandrivorans]